MATLSIQTSVQRQRIVNQFIHAKHLCLPVKFQVKVACPLLAKAKDGSISLVNNKEPFKVLKAFRNDLLIEREGMSVRIPINSNKIITIEKVA